MQHLDFDNFAFTYNIANLLQHCEFTVTTLQMHLDIANALRHSSNLFTPTVSPKPSLSIGVGSIANFFHHCPDNVFQIALGGNSYSSLQRIGAILRNGAKLFAVGTTSSLLMYERRKKVDSLLKAAELIRTTCVVWPNPSSEVLLAGSFDGWTSQRKMEISKTGIFSLWLKLYPGKYEIKFIVDGQWKVDPLRPTAHNNGYENNILIIT